MFGYGLKICVSDPVVQYIVVCDETTLTCRDILCTRSRSLRSLMGTWKGEME